MNYKIIYVDLANKPDWFKKISPLGKVPVMKIGEKGRLSSTYNP
jgi:glutathione S-transferase